MARCMRAGQSLRLRLRSGLRQSGRVFDPGGFMARLKPCPFEVLAGGRVVVGWAFVNPLVTVKQS